MTMGTMHETAAAAAAGFHNVGMPNAIETLSRLSRSQRRVLEWAAMGLPAKEVAVALGISEQTVKNRLASVYRTLDATSLVDAMNKVGWVRFS